MPKVRNARDHECICPKRPSCHEHGWAEHGGGEPDLCQPHDHGDTPSLDAIRARDAEVDTSPLWRGWETQHPTIAQLVRDRRALLMLLGDG
jgi:hypothetical protein